MDTSKYVAEFNDKFYRRAATIVIGFLLYGAIPNSNQTAMLVAASYAESAVQSPEGQKLITLVRKKANSYLDNQLSELDEKVEKKIDKVVENIHNTKDQKDEESK